MNLIEPPKRAIVLDPVKAELHDKIAPHLDAIRKNFNPSCKVTLLLRLPGQENGELIVTDDNIEEVEKAIQRKKIKMLRENG